MTHKPTNPAALAAIRAAQNWHQWGAPHSLVTLARVLEAARRAEARGELCAGHCGP